MTETYRDTCEDLRSKPRRWVVTGAAGFIGSHLVETLLSLRQTVVGLDNFTAGTPGNLQLALKNASSRSKKNFFFTNGSIENYDTCRSIFKGAAFVLHQAALGSVPRSIKYPLETSQVNVSGHTNVVTAAVQADVQRVVYASSSSVYGDNSTLPKTELSIGSPLSPYAASKQINELCASVYERCYGLSTVGLRYFNVYGPRQSSSSEYSAVIPQWITNMIKQLDVSIHGSGSTTRDFCHVEDAVQANILAATALKLQRPEVFNVAVGEETSLQELFELLKQELLELGVSYDRSPRHTSCRNGNIPHSRADITKAKSLLKYSPHFRIENGIKNTVAWYRGRFA